jgi:hypothetical protein
LPNRRKFIWGKAFCCADVLAAMFVPLLATIVAAGAVPPEPPPPSHALESTRFFSAPMLFGVDAAIAGSQTSTGFFWGFRPELLAGWRQKGIEVPYGVGVGGYAEIVGSTGTSQIFLGGGATIAGYFGRLGIAASAGLDVDWYHASPNASPVVGLFIGYRTAEFGTVDIPFGVRVDYRPPLGPLPSTVAVTLQLDLFVGATVAFFVTVVQAAVR